MKRIIRIYVEVEVQEEIQAFKVCDQLFVTMRGVKRDLPEDLGKIVDVAIGDPTAE